MGGKAAGLVVDLAHQRAGGVDDRQVAAAGRLLADLGRDAVGGEDDDGSGRHLVELLHEDRPPALQVADDMAVVHDLPADVDRRAEAFDGPLHDLDGPLDAGTERAWRGEHDVVPADGAGPALQRGSHPHQGGEGPHPADRHVGQATFGRVRDGADNGYGPVGRELIDQPGRLHVDGDGAGSGESRPRPTADEVG